MVTVTLAAEAAPTARPGTARVPVSSGSAAVITRSSERRYWVTVGAAAVAPPFSVVSVTLKPAPTVPPAGGFEIALTRRSALRTSMVVAESLQLLFSLLSEIAFTPSAQTAR